MSIGLELWLRKRSHDWVIRLHAASDIRRRMRQQCFDYGNRGHGNRANRRSRQMWLASRADTFDLGETVRYILGP